MSIKARLVSMGLIFTALPLLVFTAIAYYQNVKMRTLAAEENKTQAVSELKHIVNGVYNMLTAQQELLQHTVTANINLASETLKKDGSLSLTSNKISWEAVNQLSRDTVNVTLPQMQIGATPIPQNWDVNKSSPVVDYVTHLLGGTCTIFQLMNPEGDMLRISTNIVGKDSKRTISTFIPAVNPDGKKNPVIETVMAGQTFIGRAFVVDSWYIAAYKPVFDSGNKIIGMIYYGIKEETAKLIRKQITEIKIGKTGYVYVIDSKGKYIISQFGQSDGKVLWDVKDSDGKFFIQDIVKKALTLKNGETAETRYMWKNKDEAARSKIVIFTYLPQWDWIIGAGSYEEEVFAGADLIAKISKKTNMILLLTSFAFIIVAASLFYYYSNAIAKAINKVVKLAEAIASGDMTQRLEIKSKDEIGIMSKALNNTCEKLSIALNEIQTNSITLASASEEVSAISADLAKASDKMTSQAETMSSSTGSMASSIKAVDASAEKMSTNLQNVSAATTQLSHNMSSVAAASEQSQTNIYSIASASEKLTSSISSIAQNAQNATSTTTEAVQSAQEASAQVASLVNASVEIEKIISVIMTISDQTKLLALNATIEAARAGEAGKGFAVVASEVKDLARQTNEATDDIKKRILSMKSITESTVEKINNINKVVEQVNLAVGTITHAVDEQNSTVQENAHSISQIAQGVQEVNKNVNEINQGITSIAQNIEEVSADAKDVAKNAGQASAETNTVAENIDLINNAISDTGKNSQQLNVAAADLAKMAAALQNMTANFKVSKS